MRVGNPSLLNCLEGSSSVGGGVNVGWNGRFENRMVRHG